MSFRRRASTAIYTRSEGIVAWQGSPEQEEPQRRKTSRSRAAIRAGVQPRCLVRDRGPALRCRKANGGRSIAAGYAVLLYSDPHRRDGDGDAALQIAAQFVDTSPDHSLQHRTKEKSMETTAGKLPARTRRLSRV